MITPTVRFRSLIMKCETAEISLVAEADRHTDRVEFESSRSAVYLEANQFGTSR